jgi:hypothetical protein
MNLQEDLMTEAKRLANLGEDYGSIVGKLDAEYQKRLKGYILDMDQDLANKTIYGRVAWRERINVPKGKGRPKKN